MPLSAATPAYAILLRLAIIVPVMLVLASVALLVRSWKRSEQATAAVARSYQIRADIEGLFSTMQLLATAQNSYRLTGHEAVLEPSLAARERALEHLRALEAPRLSPLAHHPEVPRLRPLIVSLLAAVGSTENPPSLNEVYGRASLASTDASDGRLRELRTLLNRMSTHETRLLQSRLTELDRSKSNQRRVAAGIIAVQVGLGVALAVTAQKVASLRQLVTMCAWTKKIKMNGQWVTLEEYLAAEHRVDITHGISPEEAAKHAPKRRNTSAST